MTAESISRSGKRSSGATAKIISSRQPKKERVVNETKLAKESKIDISKLSKDQMRNLVKLLEQKKGK